MTSRTEVPPERVRWPIVGAGVAVAGIFAAATLILTEPPDSVRRGMPHNPADSVVAAWAAVAGGTEVLDSLRSVAFTVTRIEYDTLTGRAQTVESQNVWIRWRPGRRAVRIETQAPGVQTVLALDGDGVWAQENGVLTPDGAPALQRALRATHEVLRWIEFPYSLGDSSVQRAYRGPTDRAEPPMADETSAGSAHGERSDFHAVTVDLDVPEGVPSSYTYYFPLGDRFPTDLTYRAGDRTVREVLGSIERAGPISMAYVTRRDLFAESGTRLETVLVADLVVNNDVSNVRFERPAD